MKLTPIKRYILLTAIMMVAVAYVLHSKPPRAASSQLDQFPHTILWAWERPEDLSFINPNKIAVAFLAQTLTLTANQVHVALRQQPLKVPQQTKLIAVTRIETNEMPTLSNAQRDELVRLVLNTLKLKNVSAVQIDFDAKVSQRDFYRTFLTELRSKLPDTVPLSMTALASFCLSDPWINDLPVDEAVPMIFRMGLDNNTVKQRLKNGKDFSIPICQHSYGIATDEPVSINVAKTRRIYVFKGTASAWNQADITALLH